MLTALVLCVDRAYFLNIIQERVRAAQLVLISPTGKRESCDQRASKRLMGLAKHPENKGSQVFIECLLCASPCMGLFACIYLFHVVVMRDRWLPSQLPLGEAEEWCSPSWKNPTPRKQDVSRLVCTPQLPFASKSICRAAVSLRPHRAPRRDLQNPSVSWEGERVSAVLLIASDSLSSLA